MNWWYRAGGNISSASAGRSGDGAKLLSEWVEGMQPALAGMQAFHLPPDFPFDYSRESIHRLEEILLDRFATSEEVRRPETSIFVENYARYIGEAWLRVGGGHWHWDDNPNSAYRDRPILFLDPRIGNVAISPLNLIYSVVAKRDGVLTRLYDRLVEDVAAWKAEHPGETPVKEPTPGLDEIPRPQASDWLVEWLEGMDQALRAWIGELPLPASRWDFSLRSLDDLEEVVTARLTTTDDFKRPENQTYIDGCVRYLGETLRRNFGGAWVYTPGKPSEQNPWVAQPYLERVDSDGEEVTALPALALRALVKRRQRGHFGQVADAYAA